MLNLSLARAAQHFAPHRQALPRSLSHLRSTPALLVPVPFPFTPMPPFRLPALFHQCSESSSCWQDRATQADGDQRHRSPPSYPSPVPPLMMSPRSPGSGGGGGRGGAAIIMTPGSRRSRHSTQRQTFSQSSSSGSSPRERGEREGWDGCDSALPASLVFTPTVSPVRRGRRPFPVDRQAESSPSYVRAYEAAAAERGGQSPKSPVSIHSYGYRSPRYGASDDGESSSSRAARAGAGGGGGGGGNDRRGSSPGRSFSCAVSGGGAAAVVARERGGWTRPVIEGGSLLLAAGEGCSCSAAI